MTVLALDFGTSNSAAAILADGKPHRLPIEAGADTLPTAVFLPGDKGPMRLGQAAIDALITGEEGRFMRAMKSVLGTPLFHESRPIGGKRRSLAEVVTAFLAEVKARAEAVAGTRFDRVLSGRPVHFHSADQGRDARAEADLRGCYAAAGFDKVAFLFEPEAAARAAQAEGALDGLGLIVDTGGGTSDYSVFRPDGRVLASHGLRLGGTDFDRVLSMTHAMPWLGLGGQLRRDLGEGLLPVPRHLYLDLATWAKIPFLYNADTRAAAANMARLAVKPRPMRRLVRVLEAELGHDLAFAVEAGKIAANAQDGARIDLGKIEPGLSVPITPASSNRALERYREALGAAAGEVCRMADVEAGAIAEVVLVGGSSLMQVVRDEMQVRFPQARMRTAEVFTAVVDGLALATQDAAFA